MRFGIRTKLLLTMLGLAVSAVAAVSYLSFQMGRRSLEDESFNKLTAVREMKARQIEEYFTNLRSHVHTFAESRTAIDGMEKLGAAFRGLQSHGAPELVADMGAGEQLQAYYRDEFLPALSPNIDGEAQLESFWPRGQAARLLQHLYIAKNRNATGSKHLLDDAGDGGQYSEAHAEFHPIFREYLEHFGFYDIFLVDIETGHIVYSVFKEVDFGTSLLSGPYQDSKIAAAFRAIQQSEDGNLVRLVDYAPYPPSYNAPASFIAAPVRHQQKAIGVLIFQMPVDKIDQIMTNGRAWADAGLGQSGEAYLVGEDHKLRNQSRFLIEDRESYLRAIEQAGVPADTRAKIANFNSTIGLQEVKTPGTAAALAGSTGTAIFPDYRGVPVLSAYKPLQIEDVHWVLLSEIDEAEAFAPIAQLKRRMLGVMALIFVVIAGVAVLFSRTLSRPLRMLSQRAAALAHGDLDTSLAIRRTDEIGQLATSFSKMRRAIKKLVGDLEQNNLELEDRVAERTQDLEQAHQRIRAILQNASDGVITHDDEGKIVLFNPAAEKIFDYEADEVMGRSIDELLPEDLRAGHAELIRDFRDAPETSRAMDQRPVIRGQRKDGTVFPVEVGISKMKAGDDVFMTAFVRDVSERKRAEEAILSQKQLLENTLESLTHPFYVIDANDYTIQVANKAAKKVAGGEVTTCHAMTHRSDTPCGSADDPCPLDEVKRTGKPVVLEHTHYDEQGNAVSAEVHGYPIFDPLGNVVQMIEYSLDITERKKAEAQLRLQSAALESAANGIAITDPKGILQWVNPAFSKLTGYSAEEAVGQNPRVIKSGEHGPEFYANMWSTISSGKVWHGEVVNQRKDGSHYTEEMTITPVPGDDGAPTHYVAIKADVSERKQLEQDLQGAFETIKAQKDRMEGELTVARDIQMSMLPLIFPAFPEHDELDVHAVVYPAREVGGDFYDFFFLDERRFCFVIGDVSDKGVPAALFMAVTKTLIKSRALEDGSPASILTHVNDELSKDNDSCMFVTLFIAILDTASGEVTYTNAGHNPPYIKRESGAVEALAQRHGPVLGAMEGVTYRSTTLRLSTGDQMVLFTDGVTEAMSPAKKLFGETRLVELLEGDSLNVPKKIVTKVIDSVQAFEDGSEQSDDVTVLTVQYKGDPDHEGGGGFRLNIGGDLNEIAGANTAFNEFAEQRGVPAKVARKINMVLDEMLNNTITYAFPDGVESSIEVRADVIADRIVLTITDSGVPFNPFAMESPDTELDIEEREIGGLGIHLVRNVMDECSYSRRVDRNVVTLTKSLKDG